MCVVLLSLYSAIFNYSSSCKFTQQKHFKYFEIGGNIKQNLVKYIAGKEYQSNNFHHLVQCRVAISKLQSSFTIDEHTLSHSK